MQENSFSQKLKSFLLLDTYKVVLVLMAFVLGYYYFIAANRYVSESVISVRSTNSDSSSASLSGLTTLLGASGATSNEDITYLKTYILSLDMLQILDQKIGIRKFYEAQKLDPFFSLGSSADQESFLKFYQARVKITDNNGLLVLQVEGFTPEQAHLIAQSILDESERFVNEVSHKGAREQLAFAEEELIKYKIKYQQSADALTAFQNEHGVFDPLKEAESRASFIAQMEGNIAEKEAKLLAMQSYINENAPQLSTLKAEISALKQQLEIEKSRIASSSNASKLNDLAADFQKLTIEAGFAESAYTAALKAFETTRIEAIRKIKQLVIIQNPTTPQSAMYPKKLYNIITIFVILSLVFGVAKLIKTIIEEHKY
ncbi:capsule biosynthesis protein [Campylobacter sp. MIT 19-121]|uniref:capsule biosynthesis protein n=1 Tax=Campylobacter sp. MIT 19-121 TaxID=2703906 RepID=UPI0013894962|nr:capsule biosynthesis protein [Campylobacter sp. MIT 19-121]